MYATMKSVRGVRDDECTSVDEFATVRPRRLTAVKPSAAYLMLRCASSSTGCDVVDAATPKYAVVMPPSSGELWGHHLMPAQVTVDCLLPNGIIVPISCTRDTTLETIKTELWREAKKYPLFYLLAEPTSYIFVSITQDALREEYYDETRRLCDLRLFQLILKIVEPKGNREEKMLNYEIGMAVGMSVTEFNEIKDLEVMTFRRNILNVCREAVGRRDAQGFRSQALYVYPPDIESTNHLPSHLAEKLEKENKNIIVYIWVVSQNGEKQRYAIKVAHMAFPETVIATAIRKKTRTMHMTSEQQEQCVIEYQDSYLLKICGCYQFLLERYPLSQYKYVRKCIARGKIPELMLMAKDDVYSSLPKNMFFLPAYVRRGVNALQQINKQKTMSLWEIEARLAVKINCATYVNVKEVSKFYIKTGIYLGTEALCSDKNTRQVTAANPKWDEWLNYDLELQDIPRCARLCLSLCCVSRRNKKVHYAIAWGNINLFDFNNRFQVEKIGLVLWPMPKGMDDLLNPIGTPGSNPNKDSACLEIEFDLFSSPVTFPPQSQIEAFAAISSRSARGFSPIEPISTEEDDQMNKIIARDPLSEMSEQEKELLWKWREVCQTKPDSLPKLLKAVKWNQREDVAQLYVLLNKWPTVSEETAMELLDCDYLDLRVRTFAVSCLEKTLSDEKISLFLLQLTQVIKFEPYLDNPLTRFLLNKALMNQKIGHFFFWHLKSEMHQISVKVKFGLILEAYCRGCGAYLKSLNRQVEALEKLTMLTETLKNERDDNQLSVLWDRVNQADYKEALQNFSSPLNPSYTLGELQIQTCKIMQSKKRPLWLDWKNPDPTAECLFSDFMIIFKNGDDLRQDMLTLQVIGIMDRIWQSEGLDLRMTPYGCLSTGTDVGMIEVVRDAQTVMKIQKNTMMAAIQLKNDVLYKWISNKHKGEKKDQIIDTFTKSCAGYCVATFILGIGDRHPDNIMVNEEGQIFHIDFGHFLDHRKKKFGINRERVPFVLTEDFTTVVAKGADNPTKSAEFSAFTELCGKAYLILHKHANIFLTLFSMMLSCGIPELQSLDDIGYLRKTLAVEKTEEEALKYFHHQFHDAYGGAWTTKMDWFFHWVKNRR
ncbi:phosphatidylinositol 4,5-bisphosphate 3-kinase catalytic subunit alpha isoform-like isoform X2 [Lineus longissimus]|uniref:phosphatidylinositol 4,5-bisphosphate 3-kinase catalytic subunit alpha isoform-like isoform X2 n=1 Tax=Lineus longissimus TaxID=88925 RepID=UPI00315C6C9D